MIVLKQLSFSTRLVKRIMKIKNAYRQEMEAQLKEWNAEIGLRGGECGARQRGDGARAA